MRQGIVEQVRFPGRGMVSGLVAPRCLLRLSLLLAVSTAILSSAAPAVQAQTATAAASPVRVFIDCNSSGCDFDYFRTEIPWVDYVRDRTDAGVHVLVTAEATGGGGTKYTLDFIGLKEFAGQSDTLTYVAPQGSTDDDRRKGLARILKLGLLRYVLNTSTADQLSISYQKPSAIGAASVLAKDPWNYWVIRIGMNGNFSGESSQNFSNINGSTSANRTTRELKINTSVNGSYNESQFTLSEEKFSSYSRSFGFSELIVKSFGPHWSAGQRASLSSSTFQNQKLAARFAPAIEYNVFPYDESTRRQLTLQYAIGINSFRYQDTTIFDKLSEVRPSHSLTASLGMTQPWGSVSGSVEGANYLDDFSKRRLVLFNSLNARLFKGFSLNFFGSVAWVRDEIHLAKGVATDEEILLQRKQLATSYRYFMGVGVSYTFGSIFNNVVNPRFEGAQGNFFFF